MPCQEGKLGKMKRIISLLLTVVMLFGIATVLAACGTPKNPGAQIAVYLGEEVYDFDPTDYYADDNAEQVMSLLFEPLFSVNKKGKLECAAADDYEVDEDERTITITLRESYWSDGSLVTADQFVYAWRKLLDASSANPAAALLYDIEGAIDVKTGEKTKNSADLGVERLETDVIKITYRQGADYKQLLKNLASLATSPLHFDNYERAPEYWSKNSNTWVFNGPFQISTIDRDEGEFTLERNLGYHQKPDTKDYDEEVNPHKLISVFGVDGAPVALTYANIENNTVFYMGDAGLVQRSSKRADEVRDDLSTYSYVFNTEKTLFTKKEVRRALSLAIDRNAIITAITYGKAADGFLPDIVVDIASGGELTTNALISGSASLTEANTLLNSVSAWLSGLSAEEKTIELTINCDEESKAIANLVKAAWEGLGVGLTVRINALTSVTNEVAGLDVEDSAIQYLVKQAAVGGVRDFDVIAVDWQMYSTDAFVGLASFSSTLNGNGVSFNDVGAAVARYNISGWSNAQYDTYINEAYAATSSGTRAEKLRQAEALLIDEMPIIPLVFNQNFVYTAGGISKLAYDAYGNFILTDLKQKNYEDYLPSED